jgi:hypothetical protein
MAKSLPTSLPSNDRERRDEIVEQRSDCAIGFSHAQFIG